MELKQTLEEISQHLPKLIQAVRDRNFQILDIYCDGRPDEYVTALALTITYFGELGHLPFTTMELEIENFPKITHLLLNIGYFANFEMTIRRRRILEVFAFTFNVKESYAYNLLKEL